MCYEGAPIDVAYRDYEVRDLIALERDSGVDIEPMRVLFRENRMISSIAGEFDHKSSWEILTDPHFTQKYFNADERQVFRRHILGPASCTTAAQRCPTASRASCSNLCAKSTRSSC